MSVNPKSLKNLKPTVPGQIKNPAGKPKGTLNSKTILQKILNAKGKVLDPLTQKELKLTFMEHMHLAQVAKALEGDTRAYDAVVDRLEGKPMQKQEVTQRTITVEVREDDSEED